MPQFLSDYFLSLLRVVIIQIIGIFGIFFVFGFILARLQKWTSNLYRQTIGWKGILWTAWIGTPIHEIGHVFFSKLFRHKIEEIYIFRPNEATGNLGHVNHTYNKRSLYQRIGNFFIGAAPMIWSSVILVILLYFLVPNGKDIFAPLTNEPTSLFTILSSLGKTFTNLFTLENIKAWNFWVFLYVSFCVASHMAPSSEDLKGMWGGFFWLVLVIIIVNAMTLLFKLDITAYVLKLNQYLGIFMAIFAYALIISVLHLLVANGLLRPFRKRA